MGFLSAALGGASILGGLFNKGNEQTPATLPGFHGPGYLGDSGGTTKAPPDPTPSFPKANEFLGSNIGLAAAGIGGGFLNDFRARRNTRLNHEFLESKGLNSYEIAGSAAGGPVSSQGGTLGSGPATQVQSQQNFTAGQAQLDRDAAKERALITAQAPRTTAQTGVERGQREALAGPLQRNKLRAEHQKILQEANMIQFQYENFWPIKFATMGVENAKLSVAMFNSGLSIERILTAAGDISEQEKREVQDFYNILLKISGASGGAIGWMQLLGQILTGKGTLDQNITGTWENRSQSGREPYQIESIYTKPGKMKWEEGKGVQPRRWGDTPGRATGR